MKFKFLPVLAIFMLTSFFACKKAEDGASLVSEKLTDVRVPDNFTWESSVDVKFKVSISDTEYPGATYVIAIYTPDGKLLSKGAATLAQAFESKIYLPVTVKEVYVLRNNPDNSVDSKKVTLGSTDISVDFGATLAKVSSKKSSANTLATSPDCNSGCSRSVEITQNDQLIELVGNETVCISGSNKSFKVKSTDRHPTIKICGTNLTLKQFTIASPLPSAPNIVITSAGSITLDRVDGNISQDYFLIVKNYGTLNVKSSLIRWFENYGTATIDGSFRSQIAKNEGNMTVTGQLQTGYERSSSFENNGVLTVNGNLKHDGGTQFYNSFVNNCKIIVNGDFIMGFSNLCSLENFGYIKVSGLTQIINLFTLKMNAGTMLTTKDLQLGSSNVRSIGGYSLIKVSGHTKLANQFGLSVNISGQIKICDANGIEEINHSTLTNGAVESCDINIPVSGCNPEGNGSFASSDSDGDGIANNLDDYPNDATKAFTNYYPSGDAAAGATVLFEDMWPLKGDYDMNDVVMSYNLKIITNAQNKVSSVDGTYSLRARGGIYQNGFGIEFPINRSLVSNVIGGTLEQGQQKAVIILFSNMQSQLSRMNTNDSEPVSDAKVYPISFSISNGPSLAEFGLGEYNPFIWNQASGRGCEIHLPGKTPTSLANTALFGSGDDRSVPSAGKYYVSEGGYPWAVSVPVKNFLYPAEGKDIAASYLRMADWVSSGGASYTDWYTSSSEGYRNTANLFNK